MKNKAQATSLSQMLVGLTVIGLIGLLIFFLITRGQEVEVKVEENEILRKRIILTNVLLSSDKLVYTSDSIIHRGILDKQKLDILQRNPSLLSEISYPESEYSLKIVDLDNGYEWDIGGDFKPVYEAPVSIYYSDNDIHIGLLSVDFSKISNKKSTTTTLPGKTEIIYCNDLFGIKPIKQPDPKWCGITSVAMLFNYYGNSVTPQEIYDYCCNNCDGSNS